MKNQIQMKKKVKEARDVCLFFSREDEKNPYSSGLQASQSRPNIPAIEKVSIGSIMKGSAKDEYPTHFRMRMNE
jgi:hypothetical protein